MMHYNMSAPTGQQSSFYHISPTTLEWYPRAPDKAKAGPTSLERHRGLDSKGQRSAFGDLVNEEGVKLDHCYRPFPRQGSREGRHRPDRLIEFVAPWLLDVFRHIAIFDYVLVVVAFCNKKFAVRRKRYDTNHCIACMQNCGGQPRIGISCLRHVCFGRMRLGIGGEVQVKRSQSPNQSARLQSRPASLQFDKPAPSP
jgi:hypothetical protein